MSRAPDWEDIPVFVLPSTSGAATVWWDAEPWHAVARFVQSQSALPTKIGKRAAV